MNNADLLCTLLISSLSPSVNESILIQWIRRIGAIKRGRTRKSKVGEVFHKFGGRIPAFWPIPRALGGDLDNRIFIGDG